MHGEFVELRLASKVFRVCEDIEADIVFEVEHPVKPSNTCHALDILSMIANSLPYRQSRPVTDHYNHFSLIVPQYSTVAYDTIRAAQMILTAEIIEK